MSDMPPPPSRGPVVPSSGLRFDVVPYQPDGGCPPLGLLLTVVLLCLGGVAAGWAASELIPLFGEIPFLPEEIFLLLFALAYLLLNLGVLLLGRLGIRLGKVRQPVAARVAGVLGPLVVLAST